ncbi:hypothetical protein B5X24_HaOG203955 [Helicoverpa armigera]|uniref:FLYWCH-type domain-containing protein n=1 Tax=Helicoverpa armigera TaxID=29058 RepID=A0A2W1BTP7_HELAM|nr:hypothetical protein B5X24_HaOG203955 [Helicoverpa armigera]
MKGSVPLSIKRAKIRLLVIQNFHFTFYFTPTDRRLKYKMNSKGRQELVIEGFSYNVHISKILPLGLIKSRWRCTKHKKGCTGAVHLIDGILCTAPTIHNHPPDGWNPKAGNSARPIASSTDDHRRFDVAISVQVYERAHSYADGKIISY